MKLTVVPQEQVVARSAARWGDFGRDETLSDLIRAEVTARGSCPRWSALRRLEQALGDDQADQNRASLRELCDGLEYEGDLTASSGGLLNVSPVRAIELQAGVHRMVCSLPSCRLRASLPGELHVDGLRRLHRFDPNTEPEVAAALQALGGMVVSPQAWAGLDLTPVADGAWLDNLDQRLEWRPEAAASLERDGALDWQGLTLTGEGPRWRRNSDEPIRLWRARTSYGGWIWAWATAGGTPSSDAFVTLFADDANRTIYALARKYESKIYSDVSVNGDSVILQFNTWLPQAEYRYISTLSTSSFRERNVSRWTVRATNLPDIQDTLETRLGINFRITHECSTAETAIEPQTRNDEEIPSSLIPSLIRTLLHRMKVFTYAELLELDLEQVGAMRGVGDTKLEALAELQNQAQQLVDPASFTNTEKEAVEDFNKCHDVASQVSPYDNWPAEEVLGRYLSTRVRRISDENKVSSFGELRKWHATTDPQLVQGYGKKTHEDLDSLLRRVEREGYESLHFEGQLPNSIDELAHRYLKSLPSKERNIFNLRYVDNQALEAVGTHYGVTRERIRQIQKKQLDADGPVWGKRAEELLDPAIRILEENGGIALTSTLEAATKSSMRWCLVLCCDLAALDILFDIVPGVSTNHATSDFHATRLLATEEVDRRLEFSLDASEVYEVFNDLDFNTSDPNFEELACLLVNVEFEENRAFHGRRAANNIYLRVLHDAHGPLTAEEVASRANRAFPEISTSVRNTASHLNRSSQILHYDHGRWIHQDHLNITRDELDDLAKKVLPIIREADGKSVNVRRVLKDLVKQGDALKDLSPYTLRDALLQTGSVRSWRAGVDVAWLGGDVERKPISDWITPVARKLEQPFKLTELIDEIATQSGNLRSSINVQVTSSSMILYLGEALWVARSAYFKSEQEVREVQDELFTLLSGDMAYSSAHIATLSPTLKEVARRLDHRLVWALAARDSRIRTKARGHLLWKSELGDIWGVLGPKLGTERPLLRASTLDEWLRLNAKWTGTPAIAQRLLQEGLTDSWLRRIGMGWSIHNHLSFEAQVAAMTHEPKVVRLALGSQDFVRESPARELLNEIRARHGLFRVPAG